MAIPSRPSPTSRPAADAPPAAAEGVPAGRTRADDVHIAYLLRLANEKSTAARNELAHAMGDLFLGRHKVLTETERRLMTDILRRLIHEVEMNVRRDLAERLSHQPEAPRELIKVLANDEIEVAHPILIRSQVLHDIDLIEIIHHRTLEHQLAIASRDGISENVVDALVQTAREDVITTLLENSSAKISRTTMEYLVEQSKRIDRFQNPLLGRPDLGPDLAKKMYRWVSAALRQHIVANFDVDPGELDRTIDSAVSEAVQEAQKYDPERGKPGELADQLAETKTITPRLLIQVLRQGEVNLFEALFAKHTGIRLAQVRRFLFEPSGQALAAICKAIGFDRMDFAAIYVLARRGRPGLPPLDADSITRILGMFDAIGNCAAASTLHDWRREPDFHQLLRRVGSGAKAGGSR